MKRIIMIAAMIAAFGFGAAAAVAASADKPSSSPTAQGGNDQVCPAGDSGKIDVSGSQASITVTAPDGKLISGYCVKGGSANQGLGPEFYTVSPPAKSVTITLASGKDISHYSLTFVDAGTHPDTTHPDTTHPDTTHPDTTHPDTTHPDTTHPDTTHPDTTHPETTGTTHTDTTGTTHTDTTDTATNEEALAEKQPQVFTPPTSIKPYKNKADKNNGGTSVAGVVQAPSTAAQAAPLTP